MQLKSKAANTQVLSPIETRLIISTSKAVGSLLVAWWSTAQPRIDGDISRRLRQNFATNTSSALNTLRLLIILSTHVNKFLYKSAYAYRWFAVFPAL